MKNPKNISIQGKTFTGFYLNFDEDGLYSISTDSDFPGYMLMSPKQFYNLAQYGRDLPDYETFMKEEFGVEFVEGDTDAE